MIGLYSIAIGPWCIAIGIYGIAIGSSYCIVLVVEEAAVEDPQGNVTKEVYVLPVAPPESQAGDRGSRHFLRWA